MDISIVPILELMNAQNSLQGNISNNKSTLDMLTKAKNILKGYDKDNMRVNMLLAKLDQDQTMFFKCVDELNKRSEEAIQYDLEIKKFNKLDDEVKGKFAEASKIYMENMEKANKNTQDSVRSLVPEGEA